MPGAEGLRLPPGEGRDGRQRAAEPGPGQGHGILAALPETLGSPAPRSPRGRVQAHGGP